MTAFFRDIYHPIHLHILLSHSHSIMYKNKDKTISSKQIFIFQFYLEIVQVSKD